MDAFSGRLALLLALTSSALPTPTAGQDLRDCPDPPTVPRSEILRAMRAHGDYNLTSTTTATRFGAEALLEIVRRRRQEHPGSTQFLIRHDDWFTAHQEVAGVSYEEMSEAARAAFEHRQDAIVDYGPQVVREVVEGPAPATAIDVTIFWPDTGSAPAEMSYRDTLSKPKVQVFDRRVIRFKLLEYDEMLVFDQVSGISVRPMGFLSALFAVVGRPDLKQNRLAVARDEWQVMRAQVRVFPGISRTGTASIEPDGRGHEGIPPDRPDLRALDRGMRREIRLDYGEPSCQVRRVMRGRGPRSGCRGPMGGAGECPASSSR